jgi:hypothetical protein
MAAHPKPPAPLPLAADTDDPPLIPLSIKARNRMVTFRLTKEEHERYLGICAARSFKGFSELVRAAIDSYVEQTSQTTPRALESRLAEIENSLRSLTQEIKRGRR